MKKWTAQVIACVLLGTVTSTSAESRREILGGDFTPDTTASSSRPVDAVSTSIPEERAKPAHQPAPIMSLAKESGTTRALRQTMHQLNEMTKMRDAAVQRASVASAALKACQEEREPHSPEQETTDTSAVPEEVCPEPAQTETVVMALQTQLETQQTEILRLQLALAAAQAQPRSAESVPPSESSTPTHEQNSVARQTTPELAATADMMTVSRLSLNNDTVRQSYASGVALAYLVKRDLETQRSLGLEQIPDGILTGFVEEFRGESRMSMEDVQRWVRKSESVLHGTPSAPAQTQ
ncbi:hypothetical protein FPJ26_12880 [Salmonella enterica]|nr:hypothetical protein [Salmonella enterica]